MLRPVAVCQTSAPCLQRCYQSCRGSVVRQIRYGLGKTTFSVYLASVLSREYLSGNFARIPIRLPLAGMYSKQDVVALICSALSGGEALRIVMLWKCFRRLRGGTEIGFSVLNLLALLEGAMRGSLSVNFAENSRPYMNVSIPVRNVLSSVGSEQAALVANLFKRARLNSPILPVRVFGDAEDRFGR